MHTAPVNFTIWCLGSPPRQQSRKCHSGARPEAATGKRLSTTALPNSLFLSCYKIEWL